MENKEISQLKQELIKEVSRGLAKIFDVIWESPKVKRILKELHKRGADFKPQQIKGMILGSLSQKQVEQSFQDLPQTAKENIKEIVESIREAVKEGIEDSEVVSKMKELERYGIEVKLGVSLAFLVPKESPTHLNLNDDENWKRWLKGKGINWN